MSGVEQRGEQDNRTEQMKILRPGPLNALIQGDLKQVMSLKDKKGWIVNDKMV